MSGFNIKKAPTVYKLESGSLSSYFGNEGRAGYYEIACEKLSDDSVATLYILPSAFLELNEHICWKKRTRTNLSEQGGILIGNVFKDNDTQLVCGVVQHIIPSKKSGDATYIQFTHNDWISMYKEFEDKYSSDKEGESKLKVIGWYHTHPNMPVNMSGIDKNTHVGFFSETWQFSVIFNPQRGAWAVFNGAECKNCNGYIFCPLSENVEDGNISEKSDRKQLEIPIQSEQCQTVKWKNFFAIKRRSDTLSDVPHYKVFSAKQIYHADNQPDSNRILMRQRYKGDVLLVKDTCYYCPLNLSKVREEKGYIISDALVRKFVSFIDEWSFEGDESIASIYYLHDTGRFIKKISNVKCYTFDIEGNLSADGFIFISAFDEYFEYLFDSKCKKEVSLVVVYSIVRPTYVKLHNIYGNYDCVLWINPYDSNEFEFYFFDSNTKRIKNNFNVKNSNFSLREKEVGERTVWSGYELSENILNGLLLGYDLRNLEDLRYLQIENEDKLQKKPLLSININLLIKFFHRINRYSKISSSFSIIISYKTADTPSSNRCIVNPWGNEFSRVWVIKGDMNDNAVCCSMKGGDKESYGVKFSKFALIISNRDVDIDSLKYKLIGHLAAVCLNIENQSCHFYRLF